MASKGDFIGFPEGLILNKPVRLRVIENTDDWFVVNKPSFLSSQVHPLDPKGLDITTGIHKQLKGGKKEFSRLGIKEAHFVCGPEYGIPGAVLYAKSRGASEFLRNALGSDQFLFDYQMVSQGVIEEDSVECSLPVALHKNEPRVLISHKTGKKAVTQFNKVAEAGKFSLWNMTSLAPRMHQMRVHPFELGLPVYGDTLYSGTDDAVSVEQTSRFRKNSDRSPRFSGLAIVQTGLTFPNRIGEQTRINVDFPRAYLAFLRKCQLSD